MVEYTTYNTGSRALPDIYTKSRPRLCARFDVVRIYQESTHACVITYTVLPRIMEGIVCKTPIQIYIS